MWLLIAFIAVPLIEIGLFIQVGGWLGLWPTLLIVVITAIAGTWLVRSQGSQTLRQLQTSLRDFNDPTEPLAHGAMILFAGALLLTPGFFTDAIGFLLLFPPFRRFSMNAVRSRIKVNNVNMHVHPAPPSDDIIDAEYVEVPRKDGPSGWTKD